MFHNFNIGELHTRCDLRDLIVPLSSIFIGNFLDLILNESYMKEEMIRRTKQFAIDVWRLCSKLPHSREYNSYVNQLIRSSSSVAANYRAIT
jgi:hypothetical protein